MGENLYCSDCVHKDVCGLEGLLDEGMTFCASKKTKEEMLSRPTGWIPVSEKMPSDCNEDWVLAQIQEDNGYLWIPCVAEYSKRKDDWFSDANDIGWLRNHDGAFKVIAWMPLPEPYKAESEEEE